MPAFQSKVVRLVHNGMNWNRSVDTIPENQFCYCRNIRVRQQGGITSRPGMITFANLGGTYTHTITRLNNFNLELIGFKQVQIIGQDKKLYVSDTGPRLADPSINPVKLPPSGATSTLSGNPLTFVDMAPVGATYGFKYIGDSTQNISIGYYPGDDIVPGVGKNNGRARALTMGMTPPVNEILVGSASGAGMLNGDYQWIFAYRNKFTGARSNPSAPTRATLEQPALTLTDQAAQFVLPVTPIDPLTGTNDLNITVDVYRFGGTIQDWRYIGSGDSGTLFIDNLPDSAIETAPTPPQITDPITGVTRFNLYRPFVSQDNPRYSTVNGTVSIWTNGVYLLTASAPDTFNLNWLPGSVISINNKAWTIFQVRSSTVIEIVENAEGNLEDGGSYPWATQTTLTAGTPLPHIWGPYNSEGAFIFGCGDKNNAGTLFWTNGNDPDSTDLVNSLVITSPSEPLRGGCMYDGTPYVWSTERIFRIYPWSVKGQFSVQEIPGGKGLWAEYSLTVQSSGVSDQSVSWVGKDGIYDWSTMGGLRSLTDETLYPFFPHDNQKGENLNTQIFPFFDEPVPVLAPSYLDEVMKYHRLCWFQGELFYDFVGIREEGGGVFNTLVLDLKESKGWISLDQYCNSTGQTSTWPVARGIEITANQMKVGIGGEILDYAGSLDDAGTPIPCRVITRLDDVGDPRYPKFLGDYLFDSIRGSTTDMNIRPLVDYGNIALVSGSPSPNTGREQVVETFRTLTQIGYLSANVGWDITWTAGIDPSTLYQIEWTYVGKPEFVTSRPTDPTDDGYNGAKYLRGLCIECNTLGVSKGFDLKVDGVAVQTLSVLADGQQEIPLAITPVVGSEFQIQPLGEAAYLEIFQIRWAWERWPDFTTIVSPWINMGTTKPKYFRGFSMPVETRNTNVTLSLASMNDSTMTVQPLAPAVNTPPNTKTRVSFGMTPPFMVDQIQIRPLQACRCWYDEIIWDAEEWPVLIIESYPFQDAGSPGAKYLRGLEIPVETNGVPATLSIRSDQQPIAQSFPAVTSAALVKSAFPFVPPQPMIGHEFQIRSETPCRVWWNEIKWDFEPWPELDTRVSAWTDMGTPGAKFLQGMVIPMDTNGGNASFNLLYDHNQVVPNIGPFNTPGGQKNAEAYSLLEPVIVHEVQLQPTSPVRLFGDEIKWVWEPIPELVTTWKTQETDHDLPGWHYLFDAYIAYIGTEIAPTFTVTTEYETLTYNLPLSNGKYTRAYLLLRPMKAKWRRYAIESPSGLRLYIKDCEVRVKNWTDKGNYPSAFQIFHPFGDESRASGARI